MSRLQKKSQFRDIIQLMKVKAHPSRTAKLGGMGKNENGGTKQVT